MFLVKDSVGSRQPVFSDSSEPLRKKLETSDDDREQEVREVTTFCGIDIWLCLPLEFTDMLCFVLSSSCCFDERVEFRFPDDDFPSWTGRCDSRFFNEYDSERSLGSERESIKPLRVASPSSAVKKGWLKGSSRLRKVGRSLRFVPSRVYSEDFQEQSQITILDPGSKFCQQWNKFFVISCLVAIFVDPLFYYLPVVDGFQPVSAGGGGTCITISRKLAISVTVFRTITDTLYLIHMALQFRTAFIAPSSRVFGRGELVVDPYKIAMRYLKKDFWLDFVALLPLPQVLPISQLCGFCLH